MVVLFLLTACPSLPLGHWFQFLARLLWMGFAVTSPLFGVGLVVRGLFLRRQRAAPLLAGLGVPLLFLASNEAFDAILRWELSRVARRAEPLVDWIRAMHREAGYPPFCLREAAESLEEHALETGLFLYPRYSYRVSATGHPGASIHWYDLGLPEERRGAESADNYFFWPWSLAQHAFLLLLVDRDGLVIGCCGENVPLSTLPVPFRAESWKERSPSRIGMAATILGDQSFRQEPLAEVTELLGEPEGRELLWPDWSGGWELRVRMVDLLGGGHLIYWPSGLYAAHGEHDLIEGWAYVREG